jgi:hypothetical protein
MSRRQRPSAEELGSSFLSAQLSQRDGAAVRHPFLSQAGGDACTVTQRVVHEYFKQLPHAENRGNVALRVDQVLSSMNLDAPIQLSLHAARLIAAGSIVCHYGGVPVFERSFDFPTPAGSDCKSHARRMAGSGFVLDGLPFAWMITRPIPRTHERLEKMVGKGPAPLLPTSASTQFTAAELEWFNSTPLGFMANTSASKNTKIGSVKLFTAVQVLDLPVLVATRDIVAGEEIISPYNNGL